MALRFRKVDTPPGPVLVHGGTVGYLSPTALDRQWITYSDQSTCADRAGGDGVSAVRLSSAQVAWFFSDSSLGPAGPRIGFSRQSGFVHNLVVMQTTQRGRSKLVTITGGDGCPAPGVPGHALSVVRPDNAGGPEDQRYWTGDGLRIGSAVRRFYTRYLPGSLSAVGTVIASFSVRQLASDGDGPAFGAVIQPSITRLPTYVPPGGGTLIVWGAAMLRQGGTVYIYGWQSPGAGLPINCYLARVPASRLTDMGAWRFYAGRGWVPGQENAQPILAGLTIDTGFSVIRAAGRYWLIEQASALGNPDIDAYPAPTPWGPFNPAAGIVLYRAPGIGLTAADHYQVMYEARAEPALSTKRTLMISYNVNSLAVTAGCLPLSDFTNEAIQPHFFAVPHPRPDQAALADLGSRHAISDLPARPWSRIHTGPHRQCRVGNPLESEVRQPLPGTDRAGEQPAMERARHEGKRHHLAVASGRSGQGHLHARPGAICRAHDLGDGVGRQAGVPGDHLKVDPGFREHLDGLGEQDGCFPLAEIARLGVAPSGEADHAGPIGRLTEDAELVRPVHQGLERDSPPALSQE